MDQTTPSREPPQAGGTEFPRTQTRTARLGGVSVGSPVVRSALVYSLWDGIFSSGMIALADTFAIAAAVFLKAPSIAVALLSSLPGLLGSIGQMILPYLSNPAKGRKWYVVKGVQFQSLFLALICLSGLLPAEYSPWAFLILFTLYGFSGNITSVLWMAWMSDLVPSKVRGRHFAWRNRIFSATQLCCALIAGTISRNYTTENSRWLLFVIVFLSAAFFRFLSSRMLLLQHEPPVRVPAYQDAGFKEILGSRPFLFYCFSSALMQGAVAITGPFFSVWFLRDLHFNYFTLSFNNCMTVCGTIVSLAFWGKLIDTIGSRRVIIVTGIMISLVPLPYVFFHEPWQIGAANFYSGLCWSGYGLSNFNYLLVAAGNSQPERKIAFGVAVSGIFIFIFSLAGGFLASRIIILFTWRLQSLFLLSGILRLLVFGTCIWRYPQYEKDVNLTAIDLIKGIPAYVKRQKIVRAITGARQ